MPLDRRQPEESTKQAKKLAKAQLKAAKKAAKTPHGPPTGAQASQPGEPRPADFPHSPAERSARAAEQKVRLERWRVAIAVVGGLIALASLLVMLRQGC